MKENVNNMNKSSVSDIQQLFYIPVDYVIFT